MCRPSPFAKASAYWDSRVRPYRAEVAEACAVLAPFASICDVGAGPGPGLPALLARWPDAEISVIEPVAEYAPYGAQFGPRVTWHQACACQGIPEVPADVYVFCHALAGMAEGDWARALTLAVQHARRGVVWLDSIAGRDGVRYLLEADRNWVACAEAAGGRMLSDTPSAANPAWQLGVCAARGAAC